MRALLIVVFALLASPAFAAGAPQCVAYDAHALEAIAKAKKLNCPFDWSEPRWTDQEATHRRWCLEANEDSVNEEQGFRNDLVNRCELCTDYANTAMADVRIDIELKCGFEQKNPARWRNNYSGHFDWCMKLTNSGFNVVFSETAVETIARDQAIGACERTRHKSDPLKVDRPSPKSNPNALKNDPKPRDGRKVLTSKCRPGTHPNPVGTGCVADSAGTSTLDAASSAASDRLMSTPQPGIAGSRGATTPSNNPPVNSGPSLNSGNSPLNNANPSSYIRGR
jgi:hypothetical protein